MACDKNSTVCPSLTAVQLLNIKDNYTCNNGYSRYGYSCVPDETAKNCIIFFNN